MCGLFVLAVPLLGTMLGAAVVFFMCKAVGPRIEKSLMGFAAGVMIAASVWSLLIPSIDMAAERQIPAWIPALAGFLAGVLILLKLDGLISRLEEGRPNGMPRSRRQNRMLLFAVTLHNLPEGMAVGIALAGARMGNAGMTMAGACALALGIAIQNVPEGAIISMPLRAEGMSRKMAFLAGAFSGAVEPAGAVITILLAEKSEIILPYMLSFAAGAMIYVVVEELIPKSQNGGDSEMGTVGAAAGFALMMVLDVALG